MICLILSPSWGHSRAFLPHLSYVFAEHSCRAHFFSSHTTRPRKPRCRRFAALWAAAQGGSREIHCKASGAPVSCPKPTVAPTAGPDSLTYRAQPHVAPAPSPASAQALHPERLKDSPFQGLNDIWRCKCSAENFSPTWSVELAENPGGSRALRRKQGTVGGSILRLEQMPSDFSCLWLSFH